MGEQIGKVSRQRTPPADSSWLVERGIAEVRNRLGGDSPVTDAKLLSCIYPRY